MPQARAALRRHFGYPDFRPAQAGVVRSVLTGRDTLAVLPTGAGKSVCFQVPAVVLGGLTLVVSPLISLMQDQVAAAGARGIPAAALTSGLSAEEQAAVWDRIEAGALRLLYLSPERLERTAGELRERGVRPALLAVDEAHCIAEWGHDFRPSYRRLGAARYRLGRPPVVALTGSATPAVRREITRSLGLPADRVAVHLSSFDRTNLWFGVVPVAGRDRLEALLLLLRGDDRMAIVYAPTRGLTESIARAVVTAGHRAAPYHAGLDRARRAAILDAFLDDRLDLVVATCAFGMGIDKPSVRLVVHWTLPPTPESYYQEAGRAGRDGEFARCVLLYHARDAELHRRQLDVTFPPARTLERRGPIRQRWRGCRPTSAPRPSGYGPSSGRSSARWTGRRYGIDGGRPKAGSPRSRPMPRGAAAGAGRWWGTSASGWTAVPAAIGAVPRRARAGSRCRSSVGSTGCVRCSVDALVHGAVACSSRRCCSSWPEIRRPRRPRWPTCLAWGLRSPSDTAA